MHDIAKLTMTEFGQLKDAEKVIEAGKQTFREVGEALAYIRDNKLYREKFKTFEEYCQKRWGWTRGRAYQLIGAAQTVKTLPAGMSTTVDTEASARELAKVPAANREKVVAEAAANGPVTAASIKAAAKPDIELDKEGFPIPPEILENWRRAEGVQESLSKLSQVKSVVARGLEEGDCIFAEIRNTLVAALGNCYGELKQVLPYTVCTKCAGKNPVRKGCDLCKKRGWLSKFFYDTAIPEETKTVREKTKRK